LIESTLWNDVILSLFRLRGKLRSQSGISQIDQFSERSVEFLIVKETSPVLKYPFLEELIFFVPDDFNDGPTLAVE
jgi:hypothetical protein